MTACHRQPALPCALLATLAGLAVVALLLTPAFPAAAQPQPGAPSMPGMNMPAAGAAPATSNTLGAGSVSGGGTMPGMVMGGAKSSRWQFWAILAVVVLFILFSLAHRAGRFRRVSEGVAGGLALLFIAYFLTSYLVAHFHKPGQTSLIEANTMDMSAMRAPAGTVPVATEVVQPAPFASGVTYAGTVVALNDEDVYPRVPGTIVSLPVYPGDHVRAGQLLARLDDREYSADQRAAQWAETSKIRGQATAQREQEMAGASRGSAQADAARMAAEVRVAQRQVTAAEASLTESRGAIKQAEHDLAAARASATAATQAQAAAAADAEAAGAGVDTAEADIQSATADLQYWQQEIKREKTLLDKGAVSVEEYQREEDQYAAAKSHLAQAQAGAREKRSGVTAAQARARQAQAAIDTASAQAAAMQAALEQAQARATRAGADRDTAAAQVQAASAAYQAGLAVVAEKSAGERAGASRVGEAAADVGQAASALTAATTVRGYTEIRATQPGRVLQRAVSPGVLVSPGMLLLRVAQVDQVRLQAYVTQADLQWLRVGDPVEARHPRLPGGVLHARVTSIFPAADPATRTAIVEALVANPGETLAPGETVSLKITTPPRPSVLTVPTSAIVYLPVPDAAPGAPQQAAVWVAGATTAGGKTIYTCPMHPQIQEDKPGSCPICGMTLVPKAGTGSAPGVKTAHQIKVTLGASDGERTEIGAGLSTGQEVIYRGQINLHEGDQVYVVPWGPQGPSELPPAPGAAAPPAAGAAPSMPGMKMGSATFLSPPPLQGEGAGGGEALRLAAAFLPGGWW